MERNRTMSIRRDCIHYYCEHEMGASIDCCSLRGLGKCPCSEDCAEYANRAEVYKMGLEAIKSKHTKHMIDERPTIESEPQIILCNRCKHYQGVHKVQGHAPCNYWGIGAVLWNEYCSKAEPYREGEG